LLLSQTAAVAERQPKFKKSEILAVLPGMQMGPSEGFVRYLANLTGVFREGGQQAVYDSLREKGERRVGDNRCQ
jgi:hypothetical protein